MILDPWNYTHKHTNIHKIKYTKQGLLDKLNINYYNFCNISLLERILTLLYRISGLANTA